MPHLVTLVPGDGIGPEVSDATVRVLESTGVEIEWDVRRAGATALATDGALLPEPTLRAIRRSRVAIKGPISTPVGTGFRSVNVALRQDLDLFAAVRPSRTLPGVTTRFPDIDLVVVRENTEDLYEGIEFERDTPGQAALRGQLLELGRPPSEIRADAGVTLKPISVTGTRRIVRFAFDYARRHRRRLVTLGHKANIMRFSDGLWFSTAFQEAEDYRDVGFSQMQIDEMALTLVTEPERLDVLLLPNLYGDIISDMCAGLVGGLGLAPGANVGWEYAVFEPVHGSAPDIAGRGWANPIAMVLSGAMLLDHLGQEQEARAVREAVERVLGRGDVRTRDLGGTASTEDIARALEMALRG